MNESGRTRTRNSTDSARLPRITVPYAAAVYDEAEVAAVARVLRNPARLGAGYCVRDLERRVCRIVGKTHGVMVNSGSSANLLAVEIADLPAGSEVVTPALTFSTTVAPLLQKRLKPVFVDVDDARYTASLEQIEAAITPRTRALCVPLLIGNLPDMARLRQIADRHGLWLIEDSCDTLGARFDGRPTGAFSDVTTTSFYASHIITAAGQGGMVCFHRADLAARALLLSSWGRASSLLGLHEKSEASAKRFSMHIGGEPYDAKFLFTEVGYNFQPSEMGAAFAVEQLKKLKSFQKKRRKNFLALKAHFEAYQHVFVLPQQHAKADTTWQAFPLQIRDGAGITRHNLVRYLERHGIQTRPIFSGNILRQPGFAPHFARLGMSPEGFPVSDRITRNGLLIGCHQGMTAGQIAHVKNVFGRFLSQPRRAK